MKVLKTLVTRFTKKYYSVDLKIILLGLLFSAFSFFNQLMTSLYTVANPELVNEIGLNPANLPNLIWTPALFLLLTLIILLFVIFETSKVVHYLKIENTENRLETTKRRLSQTTVLVFIVFAFYSLQDSLIWVWADRGWAADGIKIAWSVSIFIGLSFVFQYLNKKSDRVWIRSIFLILLLGMIFYSSSVEEITNGEGALYFVPIILVASFLTTPFFSIVIASLCILGISILTVPTLSESVNYIELSVVLLVGIVAWFLALVMERTLKESYTLNDELEQRVAQRTHELSAANAYKSQFLSRMVHDLRTPAAAIGMYLGHLEASGIAGVDTEAGLFKDETGRILAMLNNMSEVARLELGKLEDSIAMRPIDFAHLVHQQVEVSRPQAEEKGLALTFQDSGEIGKVRGNETYLGRAVSNLLSNAIKYSDAGQVQVQLGLDQARILLQIRDQGIGIPAEHMDELFTSFVRGGNVGERSGTGQGLGMVKEIVDLHQGEIQAESVLNQGAIFKIWLPRLAAEEPLSDLSIS